MKIKGWILSYTLVLLLISLLILTSTVLIFGFQKQIITSHISRSKLRLNKTSGLNFFLANDTHKSYLEFEQLRITGIKLNTINWGMSKILKIKSNIGKDSLMAYALIGSMPSKTDKAIILDPGQYNLKLAGKCTIIGSVQIPNKQIEYRSRIFSPNQIDYSKATIYKSKIAHKTNQYSNISNTVPSNSTLVSIIPEFNSFQNKTKYYYSSQPIILSNSITGNVYVESGHSITIKNTSNITGVIIKAPVIKIEDNWSGIIHIIAKQNLYIGDSSTFLYPSSISIGGYQNQIENFHIPATTTFNGYIQILGHNTNKPKVNGIINGYIRSSIPIDFSAHLNGQIICPSFIYRTSSTSYVNLLYNSFIEDQFQKDSIPIPALINNHNKALIQWLK